MKFSLTVRIALLSIVSMAVVLVIGLGINVYNNISIHEKINQRISNAFDDNAQLSISSAVAKATGEVENLLIPVIKNLSILKSNMEISAKKGKEPDFLLSLFEATMMPQDKSVFSGYMVFEDSTWQPNFERTPYAVKGLNKNNNLAPFYYPDGKGGYDFVAMESFSNTALNSNGERTDDWHLYPYENNKLFLMEPYFYDVPSRGKELITTVSDSLELNGKLIGSIGFDLSLEKIQSIAVNLKDSLYGGAGSVTILSWKGVILADSENAGNVGKKVSEVSDLTVDSFKVNSSSKKLVSNGELISLSSPVNTTTANPWIVNVSVPKSILNKEKNNFDLWLSSESASSMSFGLLGGIAALVCGALVMIVTSRSATSTLKDIIFKLRDISKGEGDLTQRVEVIRQDETGEIARRINELFLKLQGLIGDIKQVGTQVSESASISSDKASGIKSKLDIQNNEISALTVAVHEMATASDEVAASARRASDSTSSAQNECERGVEEIANTVEHIEVVFKDLANAEKKTTSLAESGANIETILTVIGGIAEQTNLLALNAAIEAARAGEQGRGFAVVADEVRVLAQRTQDATQEINEMIELLTRDTSSVVSLMKVNSQNVQKSMDSVKNAERTFAGINEKIDNVNEQNHQIAAAAEEQSRVNSEITRNVTAISDMSSEIDAIADQAKSLSEEMMNNSNSLKNQLSAFKV
ncbi:methyl-accepting chemotaxis protein [Vibrio sp. 99-8-1]|uniref:methyl-accepting chemotaxis protein n=1 Tax=Vibrio sp. 99-8-1 TaxID=2607602 RepID=UPI001493C919|nr:methyl-accepting chemotaxis protein [Vibrio sp. 99-8-1]NOI68547.1 methyl-accepting chemotaxis protein [Vibrio sp. 99-8-1]